MGREHDLGTLEVGKRVDISAFSNNPMTVEPANILEAVPTLTMTAGRVTHQA